MAAFFESNLKVPCLPETWEDTQESCPLISSSGAWVEKLLGNSSPLCVLAMRLGLGRSPKSPGVQPNKGFPQPQSSVTFSHSAPPAFPLT